MSALAASTPRTAATVAVPDGLDWLDRTLLAGNGTVTTLIESATGEPVRTSVLRTAGPESYDALVALVGRWWRPDAHELDPVGGRVAVRQVVLRGAASRRPWVTADTLIAIDRLPAWMRDELARDGSSIGRIIDRHGVETHRTLLRAGLGPAGETAATLEVAPADTVAWREYAIALGGRRVAVLNEVLVPGRLLSASEAGGSTIAIGASREGH